jgi:uncharacterized protein YjbJ (UPF0337 family)
MAKRLSIVQVVFTDGFPVWRQRTWSDSFGLRHRGSRSFHVVGVRLRKRQEKAMSSTTDKIKGAANEVAGKAKQAVGSATGDKALHAKGVGQEAKGDAQKAMGQAKDSIKKVIDRS